MPCAASSTLAGTASTTLRTCINFKQKHLILTNPEQILRSLVSFSQREILVLYVRCLAWVAQVLKLIHFLNNDFRNINETAILIPLVPIGFSCCDVHMQSFRKSLMSKPRTEAGIHEGWS
jgi:hypothetical protein